MDMDMDSMGDHSEKNNLINELMHGMELAKQLQLHLNSPSSSEETRELLALEILASFERSLSMLNWRSPTSGELSPAIGGVVAGTFHHKSESSPPLGGGTASPHSGDSDRDVRDQEDWDASRKRKAVARWTKQVRVSPGLELEGPLDDGYTWRKYGQKDILGAKFPRGYYRCTHRNAQGCLATKQVQRSDEEPMVFEITYRGRHTCTQSAHGVSSQPPIPETLETIQQAAEPQPELVHQQTPQDILLNFCRGLRVITEELDPRDQPVFSPFNLTPQHDRILPQLVTSDRPDTVQGNVGQSSYNITGSDHLTDIFSTATARTNPSTSGTRYDYGNATGFSQNTPFDGSDEFFR